MYTANSTDDDTNCDNEFNDNDANDNSERNNDNEVEEEDSFRAFMPLLDDSDNDSDIDDENEGQNAGDGLLEDTTLPRNGVRGLTKVIKGTTGTLAHDLSKKKVHVDLLSMYFPLIQGHCFRTTSNIIAKEVRTLAGCTTTMSPPDMECAPLDMEYAPLDMEHTPLVSFGGASPFPAESASPSKRQKAIPNVLIDIRENKQHSELFIGSDGHITPKPPERNSQSYRHVAKRIDQIMGLTINKATATIHCDGKPSIQKSEERTRRKKHLDKGLKELASQVDKLSDKKSAVVHSKRTRTSPIYADRIRTKKTSPSSPRIRISCERHLQLTAIVTTNDYSDSLPWYGIKKNAEIIREIKLDKTPWSREHINQAIKVYLDGTGKRHARTPAHYEHAITVFTECREDWSSSAAPSSSTHDDISALLRKIEQKKTARTRPTSASGEPTPSSSSSPPLQRDSECSDKKLNRNQRKRKRNKKKRMKQRKRKRNRKKRMNQRKRRRQKVSAWMRSRYKSRNGDANPRYTPHTITDISKARPVKNEDLGKLSVSVPRPKTSRTRAEPEMSTSTSISSINSSSSSNNNGKSRSVSSSNSNQRGRSGGKKEESDPKAVKDLFDKTFKTVTMTMGSLYSCIRRATSLDNNQADTIAKRLNDAVHVLSQTRIIAFKAIENFIYLKLAENPTKKTLLEHEYTPDPSVSAKVEILDPAVAAETEVLDPMELTEAESLDPSESAGPSKTAKIDPLDLLLDHTHGTTIVRNLLSIVMKGCRRGGGAVPRAPEAIMARDTAIDIYRELCLVLPDLEAVNPKKIPLGVPTMELAVNVHTAISTHFRRLPELIVNKEFSNLSKKIVLVLIRFPIYQMKKIGMSPDEVPDLETFEETNDDSDQYSKYEFATGHIYTWWKHFVRNPFSRRFPRKETPYQYGEYLRRLFVGDRTAIRQDPKKRQTSYGRQTTTMVQLTTEAPEAYGRDALNAHCGRLSNFYKSRKEAAARGTPFTDTPPTLPQGKVEGRYALSNYLVTDGLQVHLRGFDIRKPHLPPRARASIRDIKRRFPDRESVVNTFGSNYKDCAVIGVDPGEVIAASFCGLDPQKPTQVTNLHIKRAALYSPTLAHRRAMERLKRQRPTIDARREIHPSIWAKKQSAPSSARDLLQWRYRVFRNLKGHYLHPSSNLCPLAMLV
ncbi:hypothetical protein BGZ65_010676 [Modicella reniformis]|uniref:Uncharacterized protein n=1 Tax=Modicella reniformis TaxID=1440133 RepID=A0A9P6MLE6_9FUNG|nr:hypothetical protein BGZ65_010676 [Modicella reniformis]